jgi:membrane-bound serine protease (ClpP class)
VRTAVILAALLSIALPLCAGDSYLAVTVDGIIHPITAEIAAHAVEQAQARHAGFLLIRLNTPGGLLEATRAINEKLLTSPVPVVVYVTPSGGRAASAGFFLLEAADVAAMTPGTNTGAASPILLGQTMEPVMRAKVENDSSAWLRGIVTRRGRNAELAEETIREAKAFSEKEALEGQLIDLIANDEAALLAALDGREVRRFDGSTARLHTLGAAAVDYTPTLRERILSAVSDPNIGFLLVVLGALGVYVEFHAPGLVLPGVAGGIALLIGLAAISVLPLNSLGVALLLLAAGLFVLEAKTPTHGVLGAGAAISLVLGAVMLIDGPPEIRIRWSTAIAVAVPFAAITTFLITLAVRARRNKVVTGSDGLIGEVGELRTPLVPRAGRYQGQVFIHGEVWNAASAGSIEPGSSVRVKAVDGLTLEIEPVRM